MKFLKKLFIVLAVLFAVFLLISVFLPSEINIERSRVIKSDRSVLFSLVSDLKKWDHWSPFHKMDPQWKLTYFGPAQGQGAGYEWNSEKKSPGKGKLTILRADQPDSILVKLQMQGHHDTAFVRFNFVQADSGTDVRWRMNTRVGFFARLFAALFMNRMAGNHFEEGLQKLDSISHTALAKPSPGVSGITQFKRPYALSILDSCPERDLSFRIASLYGEIQEAMGEKVQIAGAPMCIYHSVTTDNAVFEAVIPVNGDPGKIANERIRLISINHGKVLEYNYYGTYNEIRSGYGKIFDFMEENKLEQAGSSIEEYVSDPLVETNPESWLTKIYVPVK